MEPTPLSSSSERGAYCNVLRTPPSARSPFFSGHSKSNKQTPVPAPNMLSEQGHRSFKKNMLKSAHSFLIKNKPKILIFKAIFEIPPPERPCQLSQTEGASLENEEATDTGCRKPAQRAMVVGWVDGHNREPVTGFCKIRLFLRKTPPPGDRMQEGLEEL